MHTVTVPLVENGDDNMTAEESLKKSRVVTEKGIHFQLPMGSRGDLSATIQESGHTLLANLNTDSSH